ncbi:MAG: hypothetical protein JW927_14650 [Deltaproteobacteria bacterium]|nr:hypothetical protein [Deltaproteobacteria bacterium]
MDFNHLISKQELQKPISTDKAFKWVESLLNRFLESEDSKRFLRLKNGVTQELIDELYPLGKYSKNYYNNPDIFLKYYPGSEKSFDADFIDGKGNLIEKVEVTMAIDGQQQRIQSEAINEFGHSPVYQTPNYTGNRRNRVLKETESTTISSDKIFEIQTKRIQEAYRKKHTNIIKYPNMTLLIGVDIPLFMEWEYERIISQFEMLENSFESIKCVNVSSDHCWVLK